MKANKLLLVVFVLVSNFTFSQEAPVQEIGFWNKPVAGFPMYELVIGIVAIILIIVFAYFTSLKKKKKRR